MVKTLLKTMLLLAALTVGSGSVWAAESNVTASKIESANSAWTGTANESWSVVVDGYQSSQNMTNNYAQVGSRNNPPTSITFSTSGISGTITKIVVNCAAYQGNATVSATVGGDDFGTQSQSVPSWSSNSGGDVTFSGNAAGEIVITMTNGSGGRAIYIKSITVTYSDSSKADANLAFSENSVTSDLYADFTAPTLSYAEGFDGTISYQSSNTEVATVNALTGVVTLEGVGTTTITASSVATDNFYAGTASYTLTVTKRGNVDPIAPEETGGKYVKVTDVTDLEDGQYLIVYEDGSLAFDGSLTTLDAVSNTIDVEINNDEIEATTATQAVEFTWDATAGTLKSASGYYIGQTSDANGLASNTSTSYTNTITNGSDGVNIVSGGAYLRYNATSGQTRFRYYKSSSYTNQKAIQLYKYVPGESSDDMTVTLSGYGYKTLVATENFTVSGATAYIVTAATTTSVTTQEINVVPANEPVFLKGDANAEVTLTFTEDEADDVSENILAVSEASQGNGCYVLAALEGEVGFYVWAGGSLGAGRVILPASEVPSGARQFLSFNEATGIDEIVSSKPMNGEWYDLQGRRVVKAQKGLYIMNGKKVLVK